MTLHDSPATAASSHAAPSACVGCGAEISVQARYCWLCGGKNLPSAAHNASPSNRPLPSPQPLTNTHAAMFWIGAIVAAVVGYGMVRSQDRLFLTLYLLIVVPALLVTLLGATTARVAGKPWSPRKAARVGALTAASVLATVAVVAATVIAVIALLAALIIALFVALYETCASLAGGS